MRCRNNYISIFLRIRLKGYDKMENKKRIVCRVIFGVLSIIVAIIIFLFSSQNGTESSKTSDGVIETIIEMLPNTKNLNEIEKNNLIEDMTFFVRKIAHFTIYMFLGISIMAFWLTFDGNIKRKLLITVLICIIYAISDEIHQMFSDGRSPMIRDVCIDGLGSIFGSGIVGIIYYKLKK